MRWYLWTIATSDDAKLFCCIDEVANRAVGAIAGPSLRSWRVAWKPRAVDIRVDDDLETVMSSSLALEDSARPTFKNQVSNYRERRPPLKVGAEASANRDIFILEPKPRKFSAVQKRLRPRIYSSWVECELLYLYMAIVVLFLRNFELDWRLSYLQ